MKNNTTILKTAAALGALAVVTGAFGAHAFNSMLAETGRLDTYELAVRYQFYHALSLLAVGILMKEIPSYFLRYAAWGFFLGCIIFCGSLYLLCFTGIKSFGAITPLGGVSLIAGWVFLFLGVSKNKKAPTN